MKAIKYQLISTGEEEQERLKHVFRVSTLERATEYTLEHASHGHKSSNSSRGSQDPPTTVQNTGADAVRTTSEYH